MTEVDHQAPIESLSTGDCEKPASHADETSHGEAPEKKAFDETEQNGSNFVGEDKTSTGVTRVKTIASSPPPPPVNNPWNKNNPPALASPEEGISKLDVKRCT